MISKEISQLLLIPRDIISVQDVIDQLSKIERTYKGRTLLPKDIPFSFKVHNIRYISNSLPKFLQYVFKPCLELDLDYSLLSECSEEIKQENKKLLEENNKIKATLQNINKLTNL